MARRAAKAAFHRPFSQLPALPPRPADRKETAPSPPGKTDDELFLSEVADVRTIDRGATRVAVQRDATRQERRPVGRGSRAVPNDDPGIVQRLSQGEFAAEDRIDLHGLAERTARTRVVK